MAFRRHFIDLAEGQLHLRAGGHGQPLLMLHGAPGSGLLLEPLGTLLAAHHHVLLLDLPGLGDSDPLPAGSGVEVMARCVEQALAAFGVPQCAVYGLQAGARVAVALARQAPVRVAALVLDGVQVPKAEQLATLLALQATRFEPDPCGSQFLQCFQLVRDSSLLHPWYDRSRPARRDRDLPDPLRLHLQTLEVLKGTRGAAALLDAALTWPLEERLRGLALPVLSNTGHRPNSAADAVLLPGGGRDPWTEDPERLAERATAILRFLAALQA